MKRLSPGPRRGTTRGALTALPLALLCGGAGLGCEVVPALVARSRAAPGDHAADAGVPEPPWGAYAAALAVPACDPSFAVLTVDSLDPIPDVDTGLLDASAAGPALGLIEALWIATNSGQPHTVRFDATVFPVDAPGLIAFVQGYGFPPGMERGPALCLDGRERGVVLSWRGNLEPYPTVLGLSPGSLMVGLELWDVAEKIPANQAQVAGCRFAGGDKVIDVHRRMTFGPGNAVYGTAWGIDAFWADGAAPSVEVRGNHFGYDPLRWACEDTSATLLLSRGGVVEDNVFAGHQYMVIAGQPIADEPLLLARNFFGVDPSGRTLPLCAGSAGIKVTRGRWTIGPGNVLRDPRAAAVQVSGAPGQVLVSRNSISGTAGGIVYLDATTSPTPPPLITAASAGEPLGVVEGRCERPGEIEVFADAAGQGETYLGRCDCGPGGDWRLEAALPRGQNVTATLSASGFTSSFSAPVAVP